MKDYYKELGVCKTDSCEEIQQYLYQEKRKYLKRQESTDVNKQLEALKMTQMIDEAMRVFSSVKSKKEYDEILEKEAPKSGGQDDASQIEAVEARLQEMENVKMWNEMISLSRSSIAQGIVSDSIYVYLMNAYIQSEQKEKAYSAFIESTQQIQDSIILYKWGASLYIMRAYNSAQPYDEMAKAEYYIDKGLKLEPDDTWCLANKIRCLIERGETEEADTRIKDYSIRYKQEFETFSNVFGEAYANYAYQQTESDGKDVPFYFTSKEAYDSYLSALKKAKRYLPTDEEIQRLYKYGERLGQKGVVIDSTMRSSVGKLAIQLMLFIGAFVSMMIFVWLTSGKYFLVAGAVALAFVIHILSKNIDWDFTFPLWVIVSTMKTCKIPSGIDLKNQNILISGLELSKIQQNSSEIIKSMGIVGKLSRIYDIFFKAVFWLIHVNCFSISDLQKMYSGD